MTWSSQVVLTLPRQFGPVNAYCALFSPTVRRPTAGSLDSVNALSGRSESGLALVLLVLWVLPLVLQMLRISAQ